MQLNLKNHRANIFEKNPFDVSKTSIIFVPGAGMDHRIISMFNLEDLYDQFKDKTELKKDLELLVNQVERCSQILKRLSINQV